MSSPENTRHFAPVFETMLRPLPHEKEYERLAADAFQACAEWFGAPIDPDRPFLLCVSPHDHPACCYLDAQYLIYLPATPDIPAQRCEVIGHEMYHRVTTRRPGLRDEIWIDELLAFCAQQWFLRRHGYGEYAQLRRDDDAKRRVRVDIHALRCVTAVPALDVWLRDPTFYSEHFHTDIGRLGSALFQLVPDRHLTGLAWAASLCDWVEDLPEDRRAPVRCLLGLPGDAGLVTGDHHLRREFGIALRQVGRLEESLAVLETVMALAPDHAGSHHALAFTLRDLGRHAEARAAWCRADEIDPTLYRAAFNLAASFTVEGDFPSAIVWYERALQRRPDWPQAWYCLGKAYAGDKQHEKARECWQKLVTGDDPYWTRWAEDGLESVQDDLDRAP